MSVGGAGNNTIRFSGMATGLDTESIVKQMMKAEQMKIDKEDQQRQIVQWRQEAYREIIDDIMDFKNKYFDVLSKDYIMRPSNLSGFDISYTDDSKLGITAAPGAETGKYKVNITAKATQGRLSSETGNITNSVTPGEWQGKTISFKVEGIENPVPITLDGSLGSKAAVITNINDKLRTANLNTKIQAVDSGAGIEFMVLGDEAVKVTSDATNPIADMSNISGRVFGMDKSTKLNDITTAGGNTPVLLELMVDGEAVHVSVNNTDGNATIADLNVAITEATEGKVQARYSELTGKFTLTRSETGSNHRVSIVGGSTDGLLKGIGLKEDSAAGENAKLSIETPDGTVVDLEKQSNQFSADGLSFDIKDTGQSEVTINPDTEKAFENYTKFFDEYNKLIGKLTSKLEEKKNRDYTPLSAEQKQGMETEDIEKWEKKAKEGILRNDEILSKMMGELRGTFFKDVEGAGISFGKNSIGLDTSADISQRGKIIIKDADKFKQALANNAEQVMRLFTKESDTKFERDMSGAERIIRTKEVGIFKRIQDIIADNLSTKRDGDGRKGVLLERAGIANDVTFTKNFLTEQIKAKDKLIKEMTKKMYRKENNLFQRFAKLEKSMNQLNAQSSWLASQLGGGA